MKRPWQVVALLLAIAYSVIAGAGYGLHHLAACGDATCGEQSTCCGCCSPTHGSSSDGPAVGTPEGDPHDSHSCPFCTLLSKVKVGHAALVTSALVVDHGDIHLLASVPLLATERLNTHQPRGPPALQA